MNTWIRQCLKSSVERVSKGCAFAFFFIVLSAQNLMAQADVSNLKNSLSALREEQKRVARQEEIMSYVYMGLAFAVVIAVAWFTNSKMQKKTAHQAPSGHKHPHPARRPGTVNRARR